MDDVWIPENAQRLVQKYMRVCGYFFNGAVGNEKALSAGHAYAESADTEGQDEYAVAFAKGLRGYAILHFGEHAVDSYIASWNKEPPPPRQPLVPADTRRKTNPPVTPTKTVEEWERAGLRFRPAVARVALPSKQEPQDNAPRARHLEHAQALQEAVAAGEGENAPWGQSAATMAEWAWKIATGRKCPTDQRTRLADVLTVLYHAGIMPEGSIIPVGFWHKGHVRGTKRGD